MPKATITRQHDHNMPWSSVAPTRTPCTLPVVRRVGSPRNNGPELLKAIEVAGVRYAALSDNRSTQSGT